MLVAFAQNTSYSMTSRSRNRDNMTYHALCSVMSNGLFIAGLSMVGNELIVDDNYIMAVPYVIGTVIGSIFGAKLSMKIERLIGAKL